jgi:hypothetical protein
MFKSLHEDLKSIDSELKEMLKEQIIFSVLLIVFIIYSLLNVAWQFKQRNQEINLKMQDTIAEAERIINK